MTGLQLWVAYLAVGGDGSLSDVKGWLAGTAEIPAREHDMLAQALNDEFTDRDLNHPILYAVRGDTTP